MTEPRTFTDEDLTAFLDQEAGDTLAQAIESALSKDAKLAERLAALDIAGLELKASYDSILRSAPPIPDIPVPADVSYSAASARGFWPGLGVGIAAGLLMALAFNFTQPRTHAEPGWLDVVANYQMLYTPETVALRPAGPDDGQGAPRGANTATLEELSEVIGLDITALKQVDGLQFRRAQQLGFNGKPLIQVAYALPDGTPVAICILQSANEARSPRAKTREGMASVDWTTGKHGILVIGGNNPDLINAVVPQVQSMI